MTQEAQQKMRDEMPSAITYILSVLGGLGLTISVMGASAFAFFKYFGDKWITSKFATKLEAYKHEQNQEIERLKFKINALMDRTVKLHQQEFDVLPEAWRLLLTAFGHAADVMSYLQQGVDLDQMKTAQLDEFLTKSELQEWQKDDIRSSSKKTQLFSDSIYYVRMGRAKLAANEYHNYITEKGIFMDAELKAKFKEIDFKISEALNEWDNEHRYPNPREGRFKARDTLFERMPKFVEEVETAIHERLWNSGKLDA